MSDATLHSDGTVRPPVTALGSWLLDKAVLLLAVAKLGLHLALVNRYGYHRDELYFIACGEHLAFGYVDHAPLVPWIARFAGELFDHQLIGLRLLPILAASASLWLAGQLAKELGGGRFAQLLAALAMLFAPAFLRMSKMLNLVVFEPLLWTLGALLVVRLSKGADRRLWLALGAVVGVGLLNKHTMVLWAVALFAGLLLTRERRHLATPWPWAGLAVALAFFSPNLVWQMTHGWPTLEFVENMRQGTLAKIPRPLFVGGQLLYMHPLSVPLWGAGLVWLLRRPGLPRVLGIQFFTLFTILLVTRAKPYYLAAAYPVLFAAGGVAFETALRSRWLRATVTSVLAAGGAALGSVSIPVLPLDEVDRRIEALLGSVVPAMALTHDLHDEYGWKEQAESIARIHGDLTPEQRASVTIVAGNYGKAGAIDFFGPDLGLPGAVSPHMTYHQWGSGPDSEWLIAYGLTRADRDRICRNPLEKGRIGMPLATPKEIDVPVYVCAARQPLSQVWPELGWYGHGPRPTRPGRAALP